MIRQAASRVWRFQRSRNPIIFVGDVHGHSEKLARLWDRLPEDVIGGEKKFQQAEVVFLGDYCDKGPDTRGVIEWLCELKEEFPDQKHSFLAGNHDFALCAFLGILPNASELDLSMTWRHKYKSKVANEVLYTGPGHERMHLQGVRYAGSPETVFRSHTTFESYGVTFGDREGLLKAMPEKHLEFLSNLKYIVELSSAIGDVVAVHAGLENLPVADLEHVVADLRDRSPELLKQTFIEPLCGRANVERMPAAMFPAIPRRRAPLPPPLFLVSGHHDFVRVSGKRIIIDMCSGRDDFDLAACILQRRGAGATYTAFSSEDGLDLRIVTEN